MRPNQQNRRMRGRNNNNNNNNNNNRKGPNPLTRNYESNGPDVKIRGSAQQIAEKYTTLARDATSSGDRVMAENYLQHAEHYNRIIAAAQAQIAQHQQQFARDDMDDDMDDDGDDIGLPDFAQPVQQPPINVGAGPQPVIEGMPAEVALTQGERSDQNGQRRHNNNGHPNNGEGGEDNQFRRNRRQRRGRGRGDFSAGEANGAEGQEGGDEAPMQASPVSSGAAVEQPQPASEPEPVGQD